MQKLEGLRGKPVRRLDCPACGKVWSAMGKRLIIEQDERWDVHLFFKCECGCNYNITLSQDYEEDRSLILYGAVTIQSEDERINYREYIRSPEWRAKADAAKERAGHRCQLCNSDGQLDAHHRTYKRLGNEEPEDITVLCRDCHAKFHGKNGGSDG